MPHSIREWTPDGAVNRHVLVNRDTPPFSNPELRRAMALSIDRKAFIDTLTQGQGEIGGILPPPPGGVWGTPPGQPKETPGVNTHCQNNPAQPPRIIGELRYQAHKHPENHMFTPELPH